MNCRPKDLAIVVRGFPASNRDRIIRVLTIDVDVSAVMHAPMWRYEGTLDGPLGGRATCISDACLRPIRDPGDDAVDETLIYAGDPQVREVSHG